MHITCAERGDNKKRCVLEKQNKRRIIKNSWKRDVELPKLSKLIIDQSKDTCCIHSGHLVGIAVSTLTVEKSRVFVQKPVLTDKYKSWCSFYLELKW